MKETLSPAKVRAEVAVRETTNKFFEHAHDLCESVTAFAWSDAEKFDVKPQWAWQGQLAVAAQTKTAGRLAEAACAAVLK